MDSQQLNLLYSDYHAHPSDESVNTLFAACCQYASQIARSWDHNDWEDIAQEATIKVWSSLDTYKGKSSFTSWFRSVVINEIRDRHRKSNVRLPYHDVDIYSAYDLAVHNDPQPAMLVDELPGLTPDQRATIAALIGNDTDLETTADALGITTKALQKRLTRIRAQLL